jgi:chemosensory pili system protein ChpC
VPTWYLGKLPWRGILIPLVSLEAMNNGDFFRQGRQLKIIVIHGVYNREALPYWAFVTSETPKMMRVMKDALQPEESTGGEVEKMRAQWNGEKVILPDITAIESMLRGLI